MLKTLFLVCAVLVLLSFSQGTPKGSAQAQAGEKSVKSEPQSDLDHAFTEFKAAAERLGKSLTKVADEDTAETRSKIMKKVNSAILELSHTMNRASAKIEKKDH